MLKDMFLKQEALMRRYAENDETFPAWPIDLIDKKQQKFVRDVLVNAAAEIFESTRELKNHKMHRQTEILEFDKAHFTEECVDAIKFLIEAMILCNISADELKEAYDTKDELCHKRLDERY